MKYNGEAPAVVVMGERIHQTALILRNLPRAEDSRNLPE
jgi:hypothetical protein